MRRLVVAVTDKCNFACKTCLREYDRGYDLNLSIIRKILPEIRKLNCRHISITGGEPILYPQLDEFLGLITSAGMSFNIVSNGFLWGKYLPLIKKYKSSISHMSFSLDGSTADIHDSIRQKGSFAKVMEAIENIKKEGIKIVIATCLNKINKDDLKNIISLSKNLGVIRHAFVVAIETNFNKNIILNKKDRNECLSNLNIAKNKSLAHLQACSSLWNSSAVSFCNELNLTSMMVNSRGELTFCCDTIRNGAVLGSLKEASFLDLYLKALDLANNIRKARAKILYSGNIPEEFYGCHFCNQFLSGYIKNP